MKQPKPALDNHFVHSTQIAAFLILTLLWLAIGSCKKTNSSDKPPKDDPFAITVSSDWELQPAARFKNVNDVLFTSPTEGFLIDGTETDSFYHSTDGGATWSTGTFPFADGWSYLQFLDPNHGFCEGIQSIQVTSDGGRNWLNKRLPTYGGYAFVFTTLTSGLYCDRTQGVYRTSNGGDSWKHVVLKSSPASFGYVLAFPNPAHGFLVSEGVGMYSSVDSGNTWQLVSNAFNTRTADEKNNIYNQLQFLDDSTGFYGRTDGLYKTVNGGKDWTLIRAKRAFPVNCVRFFGPQTGYFLEGYALEYTSDGGQNWTTKIASDSTVLLAMNFTDSLHGWVGAGNGRVIKKL